MRTYPLTYALTLACALFASVSHAREGIGGWQEAGPSHVRLLAAGQIEPDLLAGRSRLPAPLLLAGIEFRLDSGWKTYWRTPGDGIAPRFDWSGSENVAAAQVLWPAPRHFRDAAGEYNGYKDRVILPVVIALRTANAPVRLELGLDYAVCEEICVPVRAALSLDPSAEADREAREAVLAALAQTPVSADTDDRCPGGLTFADIRPQWGGQAPHLEVAIAHPPGAPPRDLFAEASTGRFMHHPERFSASNDDRTIFRVALGDGHDQANLKGETITLTAVDTRQSCENAWTVE